MISGTGRPQENRIFRFLDIHNKIAFYPNRKFFFADVHCMKCRIRWENLNFDDMGTLINENLNLKHLQRSTLKSRLKETRRTPKETFFYWVYQQYWARAGDWCSLRFVLEASQSWYASSFWKNPLARGRREVFEMQCRSSWKDYNFFRHNPLPAKQRYKQNVRNTEEILRPE